MEFKETDVKIELIGNKLHFSGKMEKSDYSEISDFLFKAEKSVTDAELVIDIRELLFLNSSGIRVLATLFMESSKKIVIHVDTSISWQKVGILPLTHVKKQGEITILQ